MSIVPTCIVDGLRIAERSNMSSHYCVMKAERASYCGLTRTGTAKHARVFSALVRVPNSWPSFKKATSMQRVTYLKDFLLSVDFRFRLSMESTIPQSGFDKMDGYSSIDIKVQSIHTCRTLEMCELAVSTLTKFFAFGSVPVCIITSVYKYTRSSRFARRSHDINSFSHAHVAHISPAAYWKFSLEFQCDGISCVISQCSSPFVANEEK